MLYELYGYFLQVPQAILIGSIGPRALPAIPVITLTLYPASLGELQESWCAMSK
jgi:hypothetical protein